jgi:hypothetical protein
MVSARLSQAPEWYTEFSILTWSIDGLRIKRMMLVRRISDVSKPIESATRWNVE